MDRPKPSAAALEMDSSSQPEPWSSSLCGCFSDTPVCCLTFWCPCITFGRIARITGPSSCVCSGAIYVLLILFHRSTWLRTCRYRSKLRKQHNLEGSPCNDCLVHFFCEACALCQEYRELKHHGSDMATGRLREPSGTVASSAPEAPRGMTR